MNKKQRVMLSRILAAAALLILFQFLPLTGVVRFLAYLVPYLVIGYDILLKAGKGIRNRQVFDESFLMAVATVGAIALALYEKSGDYTEAIAVMLFYQVGEWFQSYAVGKSRRNISELMDIRPDYANVEQDGRVIQVDPDEVEIGTEILVQPGEKVPLDGVVVEGVSTLNTSALTGESLPRDVREGDEIISGCVNLTGLLTIRTTKEFGESTVSKILDLVENASSRKSRSEDFIAKFARVYTPGGVLQCLGPGRSAALGADAGPGAGPRMGDWIYRAPDLPGHQLPLRPGHQHSSELFRGHWGASKAGVLVKGSNYLETLSQTGYVVFDKTGTLTQGVFEVVGIHHAAMEERKLLEYAALAESASSHPISKSLQKAYGKELDRSRVTEVQEISGHGVLAKVDGISVAAGNDKLMARLGIAAVPLPSGGDGDSPGGGRGVRRTYSDCGCGKAHRQGGDGSPARSGGGKRRSCSPGDVRTVAQQVAEELGVDQVYSELLPGDKVAKVEEMLQQKPAKKEAGLCGGWHQRRPGSLPGGYRHCHGGHGVGRGH